MSKTDTTDVDGSARVIRFYTGPKDGVTFNRRVTPLLTKAECNERRWLSNFYREDGVEIVVGKHVFRDTETAFQYYRWVRDVPDELTHVREARLEFAERIRCAETPSKAYFLASFVKYRKSDGGAYCNPPFPSFKPHADAIMDAYGKGVRRPAFDPDMDYLLMLELNKHKYSQNAVLMQKLKETSGATLVEHTTRDRRWGDGGDDSGSNWLGKVLMRVREEALLDS
jgi:hypothetical protein